MPFLQLLAAFVVGALLTYGFFSLRSRNNPEVKALSAKLSAKTEELNAYKGDVQEHMVGTAQAIDGLTRSYHTMFEQFEHDANRLLGQQRFQEALEKRAELEQQLPELPTIDERVVSTGPTEADDQRPTPQPQLN